MIRLKPVLMCVSIDIGTPTGVVCMCVYPSTSGHLLVSCMHTYVFVSGCVCVCVCVCVCACVRRACVRACECAPSAQQYP